MNRSRGNQRALGKPLDPELQGALANLIEREGEQMAAAICGCSRQTLARAVDGLGVRAGTVALFRAGLSKVTS